MMTERIEKTLNFLKDRFAHMEDAYRYEHSIRVAHIGAEIARKEGLDEEAFIIACLLHDLAYSGTYPEDYDWRNHGREGAKMARPFVESLGLPADAVEQICYGIAIHVDDEADFPGQRSTFTLSVSDADNIDRFDTLRLYFSLHYAGFHSMDLEERVRWLANSIERLEKFRDFGFATETGKKMWLDKIDFQLSFQTRLLSQLENSFIPEDF